MDDPRDTSTDPYAMWIDAYVAEHDGFVRGKCVIATARMVLAFTELRRARGFVETSWGDDQHWWCVAPDGTIVDPTRAQYPYVLSYDEVDPSAPHRPIPTGPCAYCGGHAYDGSTVCSERCHVAYARYLMSGGL